MAFPLKLITPPSSEPISVADMKTQLQVDSTFTDDDALIADMISSAREEIEAITGRAIMPQQWLLATDWWPVYRWWDYAPSRSDYDALGNYNFMGWRWNQSQTISIPRPPLISINSVTYVPQAGGAAQAIDLTTIQIDAISEPGRILPAVGSYWPIASPQANSVQITFTAGYVEQSTETVNSGSNPTVQVGDPSTFYSLQSLARVDGLTMGAYTVSATGLVTLATADQGVNLIAVYNAQTGAPAWVRQVLRLMVTAWYENRADYLIGQNGGTPIPNGAMQQLLQHRTEIFGYVGRG